MPPTPEKRDGLPEFSANREKLFLDFQTLLEVHLNDAEFDYLTRLELKQDFKKIYSIVERFNEGKGTYGIHLSLEPNNLRYHRPDHTISVTRRAIQMLPGFLRANREVPEGLSRASCIKNFLRAALLHDLGYLTPINSNDYDMPGSLSFDHVDKSIGYAKKILSSQAFEADEKEIEFVIKLIRSTDFNVSWQEKQSEFQISGNVEPWGRLLWAADFLAAFADPDNVPKFIQELYLENNAPAILAGKVQRWMRDSTGRVVYDKNTGKPKIEESPDPKNDFVTVHQVKHAKVIKEAQIYPFEPPVMDYYGFVTSMFTLDMAGVLEDYIRYADVWFDGRIGNDIDIQYAINREKIKLLQEMREIPTRDPFTILEGSLNTWHLAAWVRRLTREGMIEPGFRLINDQSWKEVNKRVQHGTQMDGALERLVTAEICQILNAVEKPTNRPIALSYLLEQISEAVAGENIEEILVSFAPGAYSSNNEDKVFASFEEALKAFTTAFGMLKKQSGLPALRPMIIIRRIRDFGNDEREMVHIAQIINTAYANGIIAGISFLGREENNLDVYKPFFDNLERMPITIVIGQTFPKARSDPNYPKNKRELIKANLRYAMELAGRFPLNLWGLEDLVLLTDEELRVMAKLASKKRVALYLSLTFDEATGLIADPLKHPVLKLFPKRDKISKLPVHFVRANPALTASGSIRLDMFRWLWMHYHDIDLVRSIYKLLLENNGKGAQYQT